MQKHEGGLLPWILPEIISPLLVLIITNHTNTSHKLTFSNMHRGEGATHYRVCMPHETKGYFSRGYFDVEEVLIRQYP